MKKILKTLGIVVFISALILGQAARARLSNPGGSTGSAGLAASDSPTITGSWDFSGASGFKALVDAGLSSAKTFQLDSTADQLQFFTNSTSSALSPYRTVCGTVTDIQAGTDNIMLTAPYVTSTVVAVGCYGGTAFTTLPTISLKDSAGSSMTGSPTCTTSTSGFAWTAVTGGALNKGKSVLFDTTNTPAPTTGTVFQICVVLKENVL